MTHYNVLGQVSDVSQITVPVTPFWLLLYLHIYQQILMILGKQMLLASILWIQNLCIHVGLTKWEINIKDNKAASKSQERYSGSGLCSSATSNKTVKHRVFCLAALS